MAGLGIRWATFTTLAIAAVVLSLARCASSGTAICEAAGGTYVGGTCSRWNPRQQAAQDMCESHGGVYLMGEERCALGAGGP